MLDDCLLIASRIRKILVEALVPRTLNQTAGGREVVRGRQCEAGPFAEAIDRLDERLPPRRLTDDQPAVVILQCACDDFRCARAAAIRQRDQRQIGVFAVLDRVVVLV